MSNITIYLPDGAAKEVNAGATVEDVSASISPGLKKKAVAGKLNDRLVDLYTPVAEGDRVEVVTADTQEGLDILRHSTAHILAQAVKRLYGHVQLGVGPVIENGFYYDMDLPESISQEDFQRIEEEMKKIVQEDLPIRRKVVSREEALRKLKKRWKKLSRKTCPFAAGSYPEKKLCAFMKRWETALN